MDTRNNDFDFDFTPIGQAIKKARTAKGMTREQLARILDYDPRHLQAIENEGQKPSLELFIQLVTMFGVSVDEYIFPDNEVKRSSVRSCFQPYIAFVCKHRQNYPPRCKRHRFRISPQCLHGRFLRRLPNQRK